MKFPVSEYETYKKFAKAVSDDHEVYVSLSSAKSSAGSGYQDEIWDLPYSENADAARAYDDARVSAQQRFEPEVEIASLKRAVEIDPKFIAPGCGSERSTSSTVQQESALQAYRKAIEVDPQRLVSYKALAFTLLSMQKYEEAVSAWRELIKISPENVDGLANLAYSLASLKRYDEAASVMESATKVSPDRPDLYAGLGTFYIQAGTEEKALAAYKKSLDLDPKPGRYNDIGYALAEAGKQLPLALQYAERAVREEEEASGKIKLSDMKDDDLRSTPSLASFWDSLGWVYFKLENLDQAQKYLNAAWTISQSPVIGDHLGQVYEQQHKKDEAVRMYRLAFAASRSARRNEGHAGTT